MTLETPDPSSLVSQDEAAAELLGEPTSPKAGEGAKPELSLEEVAARAEAELAAEDPATKPDQSPSKLKDLIDSKYGGDEGKFVDGLHESWRSAAALKKELDSLKVQLAEASTPPAEPEPPPPTEHPDVKWLDQEIAALSQEAQDNQTAQSTLETKGNTVKGEIHELRGELKRAEDVEKDTIENRIARKEAELERLAERYLRLRERNREINHKFRDFDRQKQLAVREAEATRAQLQNQQVELRNYQREQGDVFSKALTEAVAQFRLPTVDPEYVEYLEETIRAKVSYVLRSSPNEGPLDLAAEAKKQVEAFAKAHNLAKKAALNQTTTEKLQVSKPAVATAPKLSPNPPAPAAPAASPKKWTADFARQRAMKILGG